MSGPYSQLPSPGHLEGECIHGTHDNVFLRTSLTLQPVLQKLISVAFLLDHEFLDDKLNAMCMFTVHKTCSPAALV